VQDYFYMGDKVLVVEDYQPIAELYGEYLKERGYESDLVFNLKDAKQLLEKKSLEYGFCLSDGDFPDEPHAPVETANFVKLYNLISKEYFHIKFRLQSNSDKNVLDGKEMGIEYCFSKNDLNTFNEAFPIKNKNHRNL